jgi:CPA2 family monovalent cation:H+ antiporter-2
MVETARTLNPEVKIFIRARNPEEVELYEKEGWGKSFTPEDELAARITGEVVAEMAK